MRLALYQPRPTDGDIERAFDSMARMARAAALAGADMLLFPELFLPGYNRPDLHAALAQGVDGRWVRRAAGIARDSRCALTFGFAESAEGAIWNAAVAIDASGTVLGHFRKLQPFGPMEAKVFRPGEQLFTFDFKGRRVGILICFDIEFPAHARALAASGVDLILVPTANPAAFPHVSDHIVPARAAENGITVAYANYTGIEDGVLFGGGSVIAAPAGAVLARAGAQEALLVVTLPEAGRTDHAPHDAERGPFAPL